jgi:hypothetical protein
MRKIDVIVKNSFGISLDVVATFESEDEAYAFCEFNNWECTDEYGNTLTLELEEVF